jgi:RNA polymerase sigma factor (TIGR02999 family)
MGAPSSHEITQMLVAWNHGDPAALARLAPLVQDELRRIARRYMAGERDGHLLQPSALVNEAYLRLIEWKTVEWSDRAHFFGLAAQIMRRILVDFARARGRAKRGGGAIQVSLSAAEDLAAVPENVDLVALDAALERLAALDGRHARVVELRYFAGLNLEETAASLDVSVGTVRRDWTLAKAWLLREMEKSRVP